MAARLGDWAGDGVTLKKVPGTRHYLADDIGLKDLGASSIVGTATMNAASELARKAQSAGRGEYSAAPMTVVAGWANERRAGAVVREVRHDWKDSRDAVLLSVANSMAIRGLGGQKDSSMVTYTRRDGTTRLATRAQAANWSRGSR